MYIKTKAKQNETNKSCEVKLLLAEINTPESRGKQLAGIHKWGTGMKTILIGEDTI